MKIENNIGWTDQTTNAVTGCDKVSPGCRFCYAESGTRARVLRAQGKETWGPKGIREPVKFAPVFRRLNKLCVCDKCHESYPVVWLKQRVSDGNHDRPAKCGAGGMYFDKDLCGGKLRRIRLFADSNSDWLDPKWPVETLARFLDAIRLAPNVDVQLLTKRIELFFAQLGGVYNHAKASGQTTLLSWVSDWMNMRPPSNVWLGVSVEDQKRADERIPLLLKTPAAVRFLSCEPLLEKVNLHLDDSVNCHHCGNFRHGNATGSMDICTCSQLSWIICGGESGKNRRDCGVEAIESVVQQCATAGVPVYCKQDSAFLSGQKGRLSDNAWSFKEFPRGKQCCSRDHNFDGNCDRHP